MVEERHSPLDHAISNCLSADRDWLRARFIAGGLYHAASTRMCSHEPPQHFERDGGTPVDDRPTKQLGPFAPCKHSPLKRTEQPEGAVRSEMTKQVETAMKAELAAGWRCPFVRKTAGDLFRRKADALSLEPVTTDAGNDHIFQLRAVEWKIPALYK